MRQIGSLPDQAEAKRFAAYLITQGITAHAEEDHGSWLIWVRDEDLLAEAAEAFAEFQRDPNSPRYEGAVRAASARLAEEERLRRKTQRRIVAMGERWRRQQTGRTPLVSTVIGLCVLVFFLTNLGNPATSVYQTLAFVNPLYEVRDTEWNRHDWQDRAVDIRNGQVWRLFTPAVMHGTLMHLAFNMIMFYLFASQIERRRGAWRLLGLILFTGVVSNAAQGLAPTDWGTLAGTHRFLGLSGVVYGLLGYLWMKTVYDPGSGLYVNGGTVMFLVIWMMLGITGALGAIGLPIANLAHAVGMLSGMAVGYFPVLARS